ncbi:sigma factor-like helix-turn-helix DNA-binding protein [Sphingomonas mali]|uniref:sigma factor-like helix-turn-helix DNA-binding protein n=1 Tax=Sphingomonas mali TaxID=40682 RepID=UPI000832B7D0|nr:sigma factor-like helix-turn-helix DNA-binding protein [Sphingomonas mali]
MTSRSKRALERTLALHEETAEGTADPAELARLDHAVRRVPRRQREIFLAVRLDNLSYVEIADRTGLTVAQVERLFAEALTNLSRNLDDSRRHWWRRWLG